MRPLPRVGFCADERSNPSLPPACYSWIRQPYQPAELKR